MIPRYLSSGTSSFMEFNFLPRYVSNSIYSSEDCLVQSHVIHNEKLAEESY